MKLIRKGDSLGLSHYLSDAVDKLDLTGFVLPLVNTAFECLTEGLFVTNQCNGCNFQETTRTCRTQLFRISN